MKYVTKLTTFNFELSIILHVPRFELLRLGLHRLYRDLNHLTPNGHFSGRTAPLTYRCCILYIYSTYNIRTEYFKHAPHFPFFSSSKCRLFHNATFFYYCIIHILYTGCAKI
jgi:hypothetical protein